MYDTIIIGSGPAGLTAAIYASRREMKTLVIGKETGGQVIWASEIENYPGFKNIKNYELIENITEQVKHLGVEILVAEVREIIKKDKYYVIRTVTQEYETKTIILALGLVPRKLGIPGEKEFNGRGVSFCANCDGPFFKNKPVAVVGGGNAALDAAEVMSKIASEVHLIHKQEKFQGFEAVLTKVKAAQNVKIYTNTEAIALKGEKRLEKITIKNNISGQTEDIDINGIFIEIGRIADPGLVKEFVETDERGQIVVDEKCRTKEAGIFAAGDITTVPFKQITVACGQGTIAALSAYEYLQMGD